MARQRLPQLCRYDKHGRIVNAYGYLIEVTDSEQLGDNVVLIDDGAEKCEIEYGLALAVIRNAKSDPIFEAAKRLIKVPLTDSSTAFFDALDNLKRLIDESEEPDSPTAPETSP